eukprot:357695-Chlamydomonas_euryale.AAC.2
MDFLPGPALPTCGSRTHRDGAVGSRVYWNQGVNGGALTLPGAHTGDDVASIVIEGRAVRGPTCGSNLGRTHG